MFTARNLTHYAFAVGLVMVASYVGNKFKDNFLEKNDEYELIRKYLLNDSPLEGFNKPKLWIHTKFEYNARVWESFGSRSSTNLNQPYLHNTIRSIIQHCGDDFHIILIDDDSFSKLIPSWDVDLLSVADPMKSHIRQIGLTELLYYYGGMIVPNSFLCLQPLLPLYEEATNERTQPFVCEAINRKANGNDAASQRLAFLPTTAFMGAPKNNEVIKALVEFQKKSVATGHFHAETDFVGQNEYFCLQQIDEKNMNLVGGDLIGVKTYVDPNQNKHKNNTSLKSSTLRGLEAAVGKGKPILLDHWMESEYLAVHPHAFGIWIPQEEILRRPKYQWLASLSATDFMEQNDSILSKYMRVAMVSGCRDHIPNKIRSQISI